MANQISFLPSEVGNVFRSQTSVVFSLFHLNAQSLRNKFDQLDAFLQSFDFSFDVIMLTETWYTPDDTVEILSNYENYSLCRNSKRGGGVSVYVKNTLHCSIIDEFSVITQDYEILTLQHAHNVFCVVYRPPGGSMSCFLKYLDELFFFYR